MAISKAKRSVRKRQRPRVRSRGRLRSIAQLRSGADKLGSRIYKTKAHRRVVHFPEAKGKTVEDVEFSTSPGYHNISVNFHDKTSLNFSIDTSFTLEADYSDWKTGNQRVLRAWRPMTAAISN